MTRRSVADSSERNAGSGRPGAAELIYDWNSAAHLAPGAILSTALFDQTLRDGLQAPSAHDPSPEDKRRLLHLMAALGIQAADIGLPAAGAQMLAQVRELAGEIVRQRLPIVPSCAARTMVADVEPVVRISQETGCRIEVATFVGSSDLRHYVEQWDLAELIASATQAIRFAAGQGLPVMFVAEDASRSRPEVLRALCGAALEAGAARICLADTAGHATPDGVRALIAFVRREIIGTTSVGLDWHGHRDRGLAMANCLTAIAAGADRIHATALGIGERAGNAEMDLLLVNLHLLGMHQGDLAPLLEYCGLVSRATGTPIPANYPVVGRDVFRTGSGTHAAAILKAERRGGAALADLIYSSVPATAFGLRQQIALSAHSGTTNVKHWLARNGYDPEDTALVQSILALAKGSDRELSEESVHAAALCDRSPTGVADASH